MSMESNGLSQKIFIYWEKTPVGWHISAYHDYQPLKSVNGRDPERRGPFIPTPDMIDIDGSVNFGKIKNAFPEPTE